MKKITVLPFGSILTQLPLIIIGALYMLYLGLCAVNRSKDVPLSENTEKKEKLVESVTSVKAIEYFSLADSFKEKSSAHAETVDHSNDSNNCIQIIFKIPDQDIFTSDPDFCLFTRPPPFIG